MLSSPSHLMALALFVLMLALANLPVSCARPIDCKKGSDCLKPWDEAGYNAYVARYNPFNGTNAAILYTPEEAKAMLETLASTKASQIVDPTLESRQSWGNCVISLLGGLGCMYDSTTRVSEKFASSYSVLLINTLIEINLIYFHH